MPSSQYAWLQCLSGGLQELHGHCSILLGLGRMKVSWYGNAFLFVYVSVFSPSSGVAVEVQAAHLPAALSKADPCL